MKRGIRTKTREFIKPYFHSLAMPLQRFIHGVYRNRFFPKLLDTTGENTFRGWGMTSQHGVPWEEGADGQILLKINDEIKTNFVFSSEGGGSADNMDEVLWRHWILSYAIRHAMEFTGETGLEVVECGVCDGISAFFVLKELKRQVSLKSINNFCMHLYDSWMPMRDSDLLPTEKSRQGKYKNISINLVKKNLSEFTNDIVYHQGYIPESLTSPPPAPRSIIYLHIDLNSAMATESALELFFPKMKRGGVILFDDYGWRGYVETKRMVDKFFKDKTGILMPLPTGQAIYYR